MISHAMCGYKSSDFFCTIFCVQMKMANFFNTLINSSYKFVTVRDAWFTY